VYTRSGDIEAGKRYGGCCRGDRRNASQDVKSDADATPQTVLSHSPFMIPPGRVKHQPSSALCADEPQCPDVPVRTLPKTGGDLSPLRPRQRLLCRWLCASGTSRITTPCRPPLPLQPPWSLQQRRATAPVQGPAARKSNASGFRCEAARCCTRAHTEADQNAPWRAAQWRRDDHPLPVLPA
jgi:hypothetical protein